MSKEILYDEIALLGLVEGAETLAKAVKTTYGPRGRQVAVQDGPRVALTRDGVTVADHITLANPAAEAGAQLLRGAARRTAQHAGDGTTTTIVLAGRLLREFAKAVVAGIPPLELREGLQEAHRAVQQELRQMSQPCQTGEDIRRVAALSLRNDAELSELVAQAFQEHGAQALVELEEGQGVHSSLTVIKGAEVAASLVSPYLATDPVAGAATYEDALVLITNEKIDTVGEIVPLLAQVIDVRKPLLIIARDIAPEIVSLLVVNRQSGSLRVAAVKPSAAGEKLKVLLEDLALLTGTEVITKEKGQALHLLPLQKLGQVKQFTATAASTRLHPSLAVATEEKNKVTATLHEALQATTEPQEVASLLERLRVLSGNLVVLSLGAVTETEQKEKMQLASNAVKAARAALEEGVVPGGGIAYLDISRRLNPQSFGVGSLGKRRGAKILLQALEAPFMALAENANLEPLPLLRKLKEAEPGHGCDFSSSRIIRMEAAGIQDPAKVVRVALENAVSVTSELINTRVAVLEE